MRKLFSRPNNFIIPIVVAFFNFLLILFPGDIVEAARTGLLLWFNNVLPALLPFIIGTNILVAVGFVGFLGKLLNPLMMSLFRLPGAGGFALATGMMSGYPMGAKTTTALVQDGHIPAAQAWRLAALCNNAGPLFILGAVGVSLLSDVSAGYFIMFCHYAGAIITGFVISRFASREPYKPQKAGVPTTTEPMRTRHPKLLGEILGASVKNAMETIVIIGGYIILFAVIIRALKIIGTFDVALVLAHPLLATLGIEQALLHGTIVGMLEITNGALTLSEAGIFAQTIAALTFAISFGGFSIHAQSANFLAKVGVRTRGYIAAKFLHGLVSASLAYLMFDRFGAMFAHAVPTFFQYDQPLARVYGFSSMMFLMAVLWLVCLAAACQFFVRKRRRK